MTRGGAPHAGPRTERSSRAFVVRAQDLGELDRRLVFFTREAGVVTAVAKAARHSRKRFGGALQKYLLLDIGWTEAPGRMPVLVHAAVGESFWAIVEDWERVRHADHLLELAAALFPQPGPKPRAFDLLLYGLRAIAGKEAPASSARKTEAAFLAACGWGPDLSGCRRCGASESPLFRFVPSEGGVICDRCRPGGGFRLSLGAVRTWRALQAIPPRALPRIRISDSILKELQDVIPSYLEWHIGRPLRSLGGRPEG